jgi:hypothetical protein
MILFALIGGQAGIPCRSSKPPKLKPANNPAPIECFQAKRVTSIPLAST